MNEAAREAKRRAGKQYREDNKEKIAAAKREYYIQNKERVHARQNAWRRANPDKVRASDERYWMKKAAEAGRRCLQCGELFTPKRSDAKYCGAKCRVGYNRNMKRGEA